MQFIQACRKFLSRFSLFFAPVLILGLLGEFKGQPQGALGSDELTCQQQDLFVRGQDGYHTYRIPALIVSAKGSLLAFCEGRKKGGGDSGDIDLLLKRSTDGGKTWSPTQTVWNDDSNTCGNPCPVLDQQTGVLWLLMTWNRGDDKEHDIIAQKSKDTRRIFVTSSEDDGVTWAKPKEITSEVKLPNWTWYATGPGNGIQCVQGPHAGRLIIPCDHIDADSNKYYSHVFYSDDHGKTWKLGGSSQQDRVNECAVVELSDGRLMLNMRGNRTGKKNRQICFSKDGGESWESQSFDDTLIEPVCQASLVRYSETSSDNKTDSNHKFSLLFSNPAGEQRANMTVRLSEDDGKTWTSANVLHQGPSAYSCLAVLPNGTIADLYERGDKSAYEKITLAVFPKTWLTNNK